jgi:hypothetical protein
MPFAPTSSVPGVGTVTFRCAKPTSLPTPSHRVSGMTRQTARSITKRQPASAIDTSHPMTSRNFHHHARLRSVARLLLACGLTLPIAAGIAVAQSSATTSPQSAAERRPVALALKFSQHEAAVPIRWTRSCGTGGDASLAPGLPTCSTSFSVTERMVQEPTDKTPLGPYLVIGALAGAAVGAGGMYLHLRRCDACFFGEVAMIAGTAAGALVGTVSGLVVYSFVDDNRRRQQEKASAAR